MRTLKVWALVLAVISLTGAAEARAAIVYEHSDVIWLAGDDGSDQHQLSEEGGCFRYLPKISPDGAAVVFTQECARADQKLMKISPSGGTAAVLVGRFQRGFPGGFDWSPDSRTIAYGFGKTVK